MTNKVKPFFIRITDDMTPQIIQDALDKCVDAGVIPNEAPIGANSSYEYKAVTASGIWESFGVNVNNKTFFCDVGIEDNNKQFGGLQNEITLDQLDAHLGIESKAEWKNGDPLLWKGGNGKFLSCNTGRYVGYDKTENKHIFVRTDVDTYSIAYAKHDGISKPETPEQREERERLEAAYDLFQTANPKSNWDFDGFKGSFLIDPYLAIVDKTNYRKS